MGRFMDAMGGVAVIMVIGLILVGIVFGVFAFGHIKTGDGSHFGYITAVEKHGLIFKTQYIYLKSDNQSSQEDSYCAAPDVIDDLKRFAETKQRVEVIYTTHIWWAKGCNFGADPYITSVRLASGA